MNDELIYALHRETLGLKGSARARRIDAFARQHGRSPKTVRNQLARLRALQDRPARRQVTPELAEAARVVWRYKLTPDGTLRTEDALALALRDGALDRTHPVSSLDQAARKLGLNPGEGYVRRMEAPAANDTHRVDVSGSRHFQLLERDGDDWLLRVVRTESPNKRTEARELLWLLVLIDDYSRLLAVQYVPAPGESAELVQRFCVDVWRHGPVRGMPARQLIADNGAFGSAPSTCELLDHFGIALVTGEPYNSRRNGRVERPIRDLKETFERAYLRTHGIGAICRLAEIQDDLRRYTRRVNAGRHPLQRDLSRQQVWERSIAFAGLRECPEDALQQAVFRERRKVTAEGWVWHRKRALYLVDIPHGLRGRHVTLVYNREGQMVAEHDGRHYALRDPQAAVLGSYDSPDFAPRDAGEASRIRAEAQSLRPSGQSLWSEAPAAPAARSRNARPGRAAVLTPAPKSAPAARKDSPFAAPPPPPTAFPSLAEARAELERVLGGPLHLVLGRILPDELERQRRIRKIDAALAANLGRDAVLDLAARLRQAI